MECAEDILNTQHKQSSLTVSKSSSSFDTDVDDEKFDEVWCMADEEDHSTRPTPSENADKNRKKPRVPEDIRLRINSRERQRMQDLNSALDSLRQVMPYSQGPTVKKLSKMSTLLLARNYIVMLTRSVHEMKRLLQQASITRPLPHHLSPIPPSPFLSDPTPTMTFPPPSLVSLTSVPPAHTTRVPDAHPLPTVLPSTSASASVKAISPVHSPILPHLPLLACACLECQGKLSASVSLAWKQP